MRAAVSDGGFDGNPVRTLYVISFGVHIPTVMAHGTEELKQRYERPTRSGSSTRRLVH